MPKKKNRFEFEPEVKRQLINEIINFFKSERDEEIGHIAAEALLDLFLQTAGEEIYRKALNDCKKLLSERFQDLDIELDLLVPSKPKR